jgi:hypothetical protein
MTIRPARGIAVWLSFALCACGDDDSKQVMTPDEGEGGEPAIVTYPPALGPEDCVTSTSELTLSQPEGAAVWGGLVVLDFEVEGAKVDSFDVQVYDPALGAWLNNYVSQSSSGQRDDGSYFIAISPAFNESNQDAELKLRVRPVQQGCPEADWVESENFTAGDPIAGTTWSAAIPSALFNNRLSVQRYVIPDGTLLGQHRLVMGDATLTLEFGAKGALTESVTFSLSSEADAPYHECTIALTFSGSYELILRPQYGGMMLAISEQVLESSEGTTCVLPAVADMAFSAEDFDGSLSAATQGVSINYLPTLYSEPGVPTWAGSGFGQIFEQILQFLSYRTETENGSVNGYIYPLELNLEQE